MNEFTKRLIVKIRLPYVRQATEWDNLQGLYSDTEGRGGEYLRALNAEMCSSCSELDDLQTAAVSLEGGEIQALRMPDLTTFVDSMLRKLNLTNDLQVVLSTSLYGVDRLFLACVMQMRASLLEFRLFADDYETAKRIGRPYPNLTIGECAERLMHADIRHFGVLILPNICSEKIEVQSLERAVKAGAVHIRVPGDDELKLNSLAFLKSEGFVSYAHGVFAIPGFEQYIYKEEQYEVLGIGPGMLTYMDGILSKTKDSVEDYILAGGDCTKLLEWAKETP